MAMAMDGTKVQKFNGVLARSSRQRAPSQRSWAGWPLRWLLAFMVAALGYLAVTRSLAQTMMPSAPELAHQLAPEDARITAVLAATLVNSEATPKDRQRAENLARGALLRDPLAVLAASTLGINAQLRGNVDQARRLFAYAQRVSRRDVQTQLWAIEDSVNRGDVMAALHHYDIALRTKPELSSILYPVLAPAIQDPTIRAAMLSVLPGATPWRDDFIAYAAKNSPDPRSTANLFQDLRRIGVTIDSTAQADLINTLIAKDDGQGAWAYYASIRRGVDRRRSRDPRFVAGLKNPSLFDWTQNTDADLATSIQRGDHGGVVDFTVPAGRAGPLLQQVQWLPPGQYRLEGHSSGIAQPAQAQPYWSLACHNGPELGRVVVENSDFATGTFTGHFTVPAHCSLQALTLMTRASDAAGGVTGQIDRVQLIPGQ